jgi:ATP synthase protein I
MNEPGTEEDPFVQEVRRQAERARASRRLSFWRGLGLLGMVGWMVSLPAVFGAVAGRWLDGRSGSGVFWTLSLLALGLVLGCVAAWRYAQRELNG